LLGIFMAVGISSAMDGDASPANTVLIVKMAKGLTQDQQVSALAAHGLTPKSSTPKLRLQTVEVPTVSVDAIIADLMGDPAIERVEIENTRKIEGFPDNALLTSQWYLSKIGWDQIDAGIAPARLVTVAILDTGIDAAHPDFSELLVPGFSLVDASEGATDENGHGTWLAGIVAAVSDNTKRNPYYTGTDKVKIMPVKVLASDGTGQDKNIIDGIVQATDMGASVILMGFSNPTFTVASAGTFTVTATGNPSPTFSFTGALPSGVNLSSSGILSGTPALGTVRSYPITITAANGITPNATQSFTLTVQKANQATVTVTGPTDITYPNTGTATASGGDSTGAYSFEK
jgi:hypothetical protein